MKNTFQKFLYLFLLTIIIASCSTNKPIIRNEEKEQSIDEIYIGSLAGLKARIAASAYHYGNRNLEEIKNQEFNYLPIESNQISLRKESDGSFVASYPSQNIERKAVYREGLGITLLFDESKSSLNYIRPKPPKDIASQDWPVGDRNSIRVTDDIDLSLIERGYDDAFGRTTGRNKDNVDQIRAMLVLYKGKIIAEEYANGFDKYTPQNCWSVSKTILNGLIGAYIKKTGYDIKSIAPIPEWILEDNDKQFITTEMLLQMNTGLDFKEIYFSPYDDTANMLFNNGDCAAYAINKELVFPINKIFRYSSGSSNILSKALLNLHNGDLQSYWDFIYKDFLHRLNMYNSTFETDETGTIVGSSFFYSTPRDLARFALLYINNGYLNGEQIFTKDWVQYSTTPAASDKTEIFGAHIWLNTSKWCGNLPIDTYFAEGIMGQFIVIIPSKDIIVIKMGNSDSKNFDFVEFIENIIKDIP